MSKRKTKEEKSEKRISKTERYFLRMFLVLASFLVAIFALFFYVRNRIINVTAKERIYHDHYVFIGKTHDS